MSARPTRPTIDALRQTLIQVEEQVGLAPDDVCLVELKRILLNRVADLEVAESAANTPKGRPSIMAGLNLEASPSDQPAVAVAVDLAVTLLTDFLPYRPSETPEEVAAPAVANGLNRKP